jgi:23S rRNA (uracil1939-C5)-methyltransferase
MRRIGATWLAGLRRYDAPDSVFELHDCLITTEPVLMVWRDIMAAAEHFPIARELRGSVRVHEDGTASFSMQGGDAWPRAKSFFQRVPSLRSLWWTPPQSKRRRILSRDIAGQPDASFAQVNSATAVELVTHVLERVQAYKPAHVVDAYAGSGSTARPLDAAGIRVSAIEVDPDAARWAERRLSSSSRVIVDRVERALGGVLPADVVILNPPRTGVDKPVCDVLTAAQPLPRSLIYVSCDPATLARDVTRLPGWRISSMVCFDMFPQTAHVETVCELIPAVA